MIPELIERARRRYLRNEILTQSANAVSVAMGATVVLLLVGTQLLDWRLLAVLTLATAGTILFRTLRRTPPPYRVAQLLDSRLKLADSLSTALFFTAPSQPDPAGDTMREAQRRQAEILARQVDVEAAVPCPMPRALYAAAALGLLASGLFALRYGLERRLELRAPLAQLLMDKLGIAEHEEAQLRKKNPAINRTEAAKQGTLPIPDPDPKNTGELDPASDNALDTVGVPDAVNDPLAKNESASKSKSAEAGSEKAEGEKGDEASETADSSGSDAADGGQPGGQQGAKKGEKGGNTPSPGESGETSSLLAKLKDAAANIMSRVRQQTGASGSQQTPAGQKGRTANGQERAGQKGTPNQGQQPGGRDAADAQGQQASSEGQDGESAQAKAGGHSASQQSASQPGSGIGSQDGNKDTRLAEQMAAMGKISEIIGKRSANVSGEVTVEVESSQQQLRTPYSQSNASHSDNSGDLSRDEVPVVFQQFVQQYFDQVRKQPPAVTSKQKATAGSTAPPTL